MNKERWHKNYKLKRRVVIGIAVLIFLLFYVVEGSFLVMRVLSAIAFLVLFYASDHLFDIKFRKFHYLLALIIAVFSFLFAPLYYLYPNYDKILHFAQPILASAIIFYMMKPLRIATKWKILFTFFIVIGIIGLHEIGEYLLDQFFDLKLQGVYLRDISGLEKYNLLQNRIDDTMIDMIFGTAGAGIYAVYETFHYLSRKRKRNLP